MIIHCKIKVCYATLAVSGDETAVPGAGGVRERLFTLLCLLDFVPQTSTSCLNQYKSNFKNKIVLCSETVIHKLDLIQTIGHNKGQNKNCMGLF